MARRNIFDRDTRAGDYSDTLGNFLESIPSIYGQLAKEKRLEKQYVDEKNFRTTQYNNQLLQQSRNNIRQKEQDQLTEAKFAEIKQNNEYKQASDIAKAIYERTGDPSKLIQVEQKYFPNSFNQKDADGLKKQFTNSQSFSDSLTEWDSLGMNSKYSSGNELQDLISKSNELMKRGSSQEKMYFRGVNKALRAELKEMTTNAGKNIRDTDLWNDQPRIDFYNNYETKIEQKEKQISNLQTKTNELIDIPNATSINAKNEKIREEYKSRIQQLEKDKTDIIIKRNDIANKFKYPEFNLNPSEKDFALESVKSGRPPLEDDTDLNANLQKVEADVLSGIENLDDEKLDGFISALNSENPEDLNNYIFGFESEDIADNINEVGDNTVEDNSEDKPIENVVNQPEGSDFTDETIDVDNADLVTENVENSGKLGAISSAFDSVLPKVGANTSVNEFASDISKEEESLSSKKLFSTEPEKEISALKENEIKTQEEFYKRKDKNFNAGLNVSKNIFDSNIRDASGNKINITNSKDFFNQISSMANRIKQINKMSSVKVRGTRGIPKTYVKSQQLLLEQKQLYKDLFELKNKLKTVKTIYFPQVDSQGNKTGGLTKKSTSTYNQTLNRIINKLPEDFNLAFKKDRLSQSDYEQIVS